MQYWIFSIQAGIDNIELSNLIEHADNVTPSDGYKEWRKSKLYGNAYSPTWVSPNTLFYSNVPVQLDRNELKFSTQYTNSNNTSTTVFFHNFDYKHWTINKAYRNLIENGRNTVVPANLSHFWENIDNFKFADIVKKDVCAIYVYSNNKARLFNEIANTGLKYLEKQSARQNIVDIDPLDQTLWSKLYPPGFDVVLDMERIWTDWDYLNDALTGVGIHLSKSQYIKYLSVYGRG